MNPTNMGVQSIDRFLQTKEELEFRAVKFSESLGDYQNARFNHYPNIDAVEAEMNENRAALIEWAIEYNNVWGKK